MMSKKINILVAILLVFVLGGCSKQTTDLINLNEPLCYVDKKKNNNNYANGEWLFKANKNGEFNLKIKANKNGKIIVIPQKGATNFKTKSYTLKKDEITTIVLSVKTTKKNPAATFLIEAENGKKIDEIFLENPVYSNKE